MVRRRESDGHANVLPNSGVSATDALWDPIGVSYDLRQEVSASDLRSH